MKYFFIFIITIHGLIHLMGFAKAYGSAGMTRLTGDISKPAGMVWLAVAILFVTTAVLLLLKNDAWWMVGLAAALVSQILIILAWQDAKFGTVANGIMLVAAILCFFITGFEKGYRKDVAENMHTSNALSTEILKEADLQALPGPVQRYLRYTGAVNKPRVKNMKVTFEVRMRARGKNFADYTSEQFNFFDDPVRLFFMKGSMFGLNISGYHRFMKGKATMDIRLLGMVKVVNISGEILDKTETVTLFNDMCLMAPATLVDKRIKWEEIDSNTCRAIFTNHGITISAVLYFNEKGQLTNFLSNDRTEVNEMKQYPFTTPVSDYQNLNGINIWTKGEAVYTHPDGKFTYGKFVLKEIRYNGQ